MNHTVEYDPRTEVHTPAHPVHTQVRTAPDQRNHIGWGIGLVLAPIFVAMVSIGGAGAWATYNNMKAAVGDGTTALGLVAVGEGVTGALGLALIGLTVLARPYPLPFRLSLWTLPAIGAGVGIYLADDPKHRVIYGITPLAMTVAAEIAGYLARSIVVHRNGVDAEADRRTGDLLRKIEWHQARAVRHPDKRVRARSERAAWRLAGKLGRGDTRLGVALPTAYAHRTADTAMAALDALYGRTPGQTPELPAPAPTVAAVEPAVVPAVEAPATPAPTVEQPAIEEPAEVVTATYATDWAHSGQQWVADPSMYAAFYPAAQIEDDDQAVAELAPAQAEIPGVQRWLTPVPEVHTEVRTEVGTAPEQQDEATEEGLRQMIRQTAADEPGISQREIARRLNCSPSYVRKVLAADAA
ncbi:hypothetical protein ACFYS8_36250 [Kitasatospora sp. NPDC004615]|uniref:helix-turn-helix domain-containing protein n=1 Tax=Kitasatospora sp. NPDC004615 TaxID=3364017 RepID=UPI00369F080A